MTGTDEARFIQLYQEGASYQAIAQAMPCAIGTVASRAAALVAQGKIQPRRRGGAKAQQGGGTGEGVSGPTPRMSPQTPGVSKGVSTRVSKPVSVEVLPASSAPAGSPEMTPVLQEILQELRTLTRGLAGRVSESTPPVSPSTPQVPHRVSERVSRGVSIGPREKTERWNLHLPTDLIAQTKTRAQALGMHPSELVAEVLRQWHAAQEPEDM